MQKRENRRSAHSPPYYALALEKFEHIQESGLTIKYKCLTGSKSILRPIDAID